jgi:hypothetical protein
MKTNRHHNWRLSGVALCLTVTACGPASEQSVSTNDRDDSDISARDLDAAAKYVAPVDPATATLSLSAEPFLAATSDGATLRVPTLNITGFEERRADYAQIARCSSGTILRAATGEKLEDIPATSSTRLQKLKWTWLNSVWGDPLNCKLVGGINAHNARTRFQDLSAKTGTFFYVINPCVLPERSTQKETCSYNLIVTKEFSYENSLTEEFMNQAEALAIAEARMAGLYSQLYFNTQLLRLRKDECENNYAINEASKNFWKGLLSFSLGGIGAAVGGFMSGGTAALQGFKTGLGIAVGFFKRMPAEPNVCPVADKIIQNSQAVSAELPGALHRVLELRVKLSEINTAYGRIDRTILNSEKEFPIDE